MQQVMLGRTESGTWGYFTNGWLAYPLTEGQYNMPREWHVSKCKRLGFEFVAG